MRKFGLLDASAISTAALGLSMAFAAPAFAQTPTAGDDEGVTEAEAPENLGQNEVELESGQDVEAEDEGAIVITGSRIRRPNLESPVPITSVGPQELTQRGNVSLGDALNQLPALRSTFSQANSTRFIGTAGLNLLDLRGIGTARTLVVVNGRRHITGQPGTFNVDVNTIPVDLLERVDIVTGGSSAVYGSDAVAGVVNFVLKRDFEGIRIRGQGGISDKGDRGSYFTSLTAGKNFFDNRGNVAVALEYAKANALDFNDRPEFGTFSGRMSFFSVENTIGEPATGNGIPDTAFLTNVRSTSFSSGGLLSTVCPATPPANATPAQLAAFNARRAANCSGLLSPTTGAELGFGFVFQPDGTLVRNVCQKDLRVFNSSNCVGGLGSTFVGPGVLVPENERMTANLLANFEISPALRPFVEAKFVRVDTFNEFSGLFTFGNLIPTTFSINNPFLNPQARQQLVTSLAPGATTFSVNRDFLDFPPRGEIGRRDTYRIVAGVDGTFNDDWRYEVALNYGRLDTDNASTGNVNLARYNRAVVAVTNASGQIVCGVNADASTTNDDPACVPLNLFGQGNITPAARDYITQVSTREQRAEQYNAVAFVNGDLSQLFELPGGPVRFAIGGEYRKETAFSAFDEATRNGETFLNSGSIFDPPALVIKEAFGEIELPLLRDLPFAQELTLNAAARVSDYNTSVGTVYAYNFTGTYAPVRDFRFRAGYARSVRAPTLTDLFNTPSQTFASITDPCSSEVIQNNPNRVANCAAAGVPATLVDPASGKTIPFTNVSTATIAGANRGNPDLLEEKGTSITVGFVAQPRFIPGLSISVDYYDIKLKNVIQSVGAQTVINQCFDSTTGIDNPFCAAVFRNPDGTFRGQANRVIGGITYPIILPQPIPDSFFQQPFNFARLETSGVDMDINYRKRFGGNTTLNLRGIVSYIEKRNFFTNILDPNFADRAKSELGDPAWSGSLNTSLDFGVFDISHNLRYIGKQTIGTFETQNEFQGRAPLNPDAFPRVYYPRVFYHSFRVGLEPVEGFKFYMGVDNAFDRKPPFGLAGTGGGSGIFENIGRFFYAGVETKF